MHALRSDTHRQLERCLRCGVRDEFRPIAERGRRRPVARLRQRFAAHIDTARAGLWRTGAGASVRVRTQREEQSLVVCVGWMDQKCENAVASGNNWLNATRTHTRTHTQKLTHTKPVPLQVNYWLNMAHEHCGRRVRASHGPLFIPCNNSIRRLRSRSD